MSETRHEAARKRLGGTLVACLALTVLISDPLTAGRARGSGRLCAFPLEPAGEGIEDPFLARIRKIVESVLQNELRESPELRYVSICGESGPLEEMRERAERSKADYLLHGVFEGLRGNVILVVSWLDLDSGRRENHEEFLGDEDLGDLDRVEGKTRRLARAAVAAMTAPREPEEGEPPERIKISCFVGGGSVEFTFLDRYLTLELAELLGRYLEEGGVSPRRFVVEGPRFDEYQARCEGMRYEQKGAVPLRVVEQPGIDPRIRYTLTGTVLPTRSGFSVRTQIENRFGIGLTSLAELRVDADLEPVGLPDLLARHLAESLIVYLAQERLDDLDLLSGKANGEMGGETVEAIRRFQEAHDLPPSGELDRATLERLELR